MVNIITEPSPPYMCSAPTLTYSWAGSSNTKPAIKCWIAHVICQILYWKWKTEWVSGYRTDVCLLFTLVVLCWLGAAPQHHKGVSNRSSLAMERSKFQIPSMVPAEGRHTIIKSKNCKSNHPKSEVVFWTGNKITIVIHGHNVWTRPMPTRVQ